MPSDISAVLIKVADPERFHLGSVVQNPRAVTTLDVEAACSNLSLSIVSGKDCDNASHMKLASDFVAYILQGFFLTMHQTGLFNRQITLFEALARIDSVEVKQMEKGFFSRSPLPVLELNFKAGKAILARGLILLPDIANAEMSIVQRFLSDSAKLQNRQGIGVLRGYFIASPIESSYTAPAPNSCLSHLIKLTGGDSEVKSVAMYECLLPAPYFGHVNLINYRYQNDHGHEPQSSPELDDQVSTQENSVEFSLVYPYLKKPALK
ncbi:MAG: hypothetical protein K2Y32_10180 [Candidatus Obscuribacterales bacterium]|nr:hypothetical protein [Candidatus Obscuribacterales bacterium]